MREEYKAPDIKRTEALFNNICAPIEDHKETPIFNEWLTKMKQHKEGMVFSSQILKEEIKKR